ncbi:hypothetical protein DTO013E5_6461 [Penicillium roqueforti]|uniref:Nuclear transport factor 2 n=1 Tax=Penicillium roqueforti (strain FM164) TaxID=1365484 RepID=W6QNG6_PENRF|nr:uncharacterized protein LCP9604111_7454 [Penicillium roqueforti]CDM35659.1 Nuclear transport factor 2 [Penicillium roqueforti FM164]KAF9244020.1 hypothetical protein LCP9604111_7454 [Penicillium roqueforti]KAI1831304.1 hypothetical protein CBS147337_7770 [Penicillium roqueforti]KAI2669692.1 hypothetical protein CBS147355_9746 [Penicillium roqueforti]KAI2672810.1 hypothetical protein LCP963914a_9311 [Penicillium roqueforti]
MADMTQVPINGNYPAQHGYPESYNHASVTMNTAASFQPAQSSTPTTVTPTDQQKNEISKDEVGWYFVEQFYTTMSRNPDKLHLFYSRRSQLVFGTEAESVPVTVGTKAINEKLSSLKFQECKVRVLNVDSQASFDNILVSVIGEISNNSEPSRKFVQTFVLAEQPNGYYVLNDIFRYMAEEPEEEPEQPTPAAPTAEAPEAVAEVPAEEHQVIDEVTLSDVDEKLEEVEANEQVEEPKEAAPQTNGVPAEEAAPAAVLAVEAENLNDEEPATPEPSPIAEKGEVPEKETSTAPAAPKTWASIATTSFAAKAAAAAKASAAQAAPAAQVTPAVPTAPKSAAPAAPAAPTAQPAAATPAPAEVARSPEAPSTEAGWQTAGDGHKKSQPRVEETVLAYIKNVNDKVDASLLKQTLARFGKLKYFDVSRPKNCAFVEFNEPAGYTAAVAANPHQIGSEQILVEERRPRGNAYGSNAFPAGRGGGAGRGRGDRAGSQGRGGFQREGRGGFTPRGRGGNVAAKGRPSQPQAA